MNIEIKNFFAKSEFLDYFVLRPLSHINGDWELTWSDQNEEYEREEGTFASELDDLILELAETIPLSNYHTSEDKLAEYARIYLNWSIQKIGDRWEGEEYRSILEQGGFYDINETELVNAAIGRIQAALDREQFYFDDMEESHKNTLAGILCIILYHRIDFSNL